MKAISVVLSAAILAVLLWGVLAYQSNAHQAERERQQQTLSDCWASAISTGAGADVCKGLADELNQ